MYVGHLARREVSEELQWCNASLHGLLCNIGMEWKPRDSVFKAGTCMVVVQICERNVWRGGGGVIVECVCEEGFR